MAVAMLETDVRQLKGVGDKTKQQLSAMGVMNYYQLATYYPRRHEEFKGLVTLGQLEVGAINYLHVTIVGNGRLRRFGKMAILEIMAQDEKEQTIKIIYYNQPYLRSAFYDGRSVILKGLIIVKKGELRLVQPAVVNEAEIEVLRKHPFSPIYPLKKGLTQKKLAGLIRQVFLSLTDLSFDYLSFEQRQQHGISPLMESIYRFHYPQTKEQLMLARRRLVLDELLIFLWWVQQLNQYHQGRVNRYRLVEKASADVFIENLPYQLTNDQKQVIEAIAIDMNGEQPMNRLIQGDVGSGKTVLAMVASLLMVQSKYQVAVMAPTEVLARQHYASFESDLPKTIRLALLVGSMSTKQKQMVYQAIANHQVDIVIGTHALIQDKVKFEQLGLVITDEQHRFGVEQRRRLQQKSDLPHVLIMSATPIPRTLALMLYGDMDLSLIREMPIGRLPIKSYLVTTAYRQRLYSFIEKQISQGRQAYIICPMVEENEQLELENVLLYSQSLKKQLSKGIKVAYLHGKLSSKEKNQVMADYAANRIQLLVSTTVIEVGVNVPNATVMIVENAERFGLAQLHQLRGRVGRGEYQSYCVFVSDSQNNDTRQKLDYLTKHNNGFDVAEYDLMMRGPGDAFGRRQHGLPYFKITDLYQDRSLIDLANQLLPIVKKDPKFTVWAERNELGTMDTL